MGSACQCQASDKN